MNTRWWKRVAGAHTQWALTIALLSTGASLPSTCSAQDGTSSVAIRLAAARAEMRSESPQARPVQAIATAEPVVRAEAGGPSRAVPAQTTSMRLAVPEAAGSIAPEPMLAENPAPQSVQSSQEPCCPTLSPYRCGVACPMNGCGHRPGWHATRPIPWQVFAHGEYIGPARTAHVAEYYIRVDDRLRVTYGLTGEPSSRPYQIVVGDVLRIESLGSARLDRQVTVQPDGAITVAMLGQVRVAGMSFQQVRDDLEQRYKQYVRDPQIGITPVKINSRVEELRQTVDARYSTAGGQGVEVRVTPAGTIQLPAIGSVFVQGLTLDEIKREVEARYERRFHGVEVTPALEQRAPRYVYVLGEVRIPGRFELQAPTTAMQAIALAGGWNVGAKLKQIVVFRRDDCWGLMATKLDLHETLFGHRPCPADEIWLRDSDVVLVPKGDMLATDDMIFLTFTRGLYGVVPFNFSYTINRTGTL